MTVLLLKQWKVWITGNHLQVKDKAVAISSRVVFVATVQEQLTKQLCMNS